MRVLITFFSMLLVILLTGCTGDADPFAPNEELSISLKGNRELYLKGEVIELDIITSTGRNSDKLDIYIGDKRIKKNYSVSEGKKYHNFTNTNK